VPAKRSRAAAAKLYEIGIRDVHAEWRDHSQLIVFEHTQQNVEPDGVFNKFRLAVRLNHSYGDSYSIAVADSFSNNFDDADGIADGL